MAGICSRTRQNAIINFLFNGGALTPETTLYMGLCTGLDQATDAISGEPTIDTNGYARVSITVASVMGAASAGNISNASQIDFPESTGAWSAGATLTYWFLASAATGSSFIYGGLIDNGANPDGVAITASGQQVSFKTGQLTIKGEAL
jgi:hypothetical protein